MVLIEVVEAVVDDDDNGSRSWWCWWAVGMIIGRGWWPEQEQRLWME